MLTDFLSYIGCFMLTDILMTGEKNDFEGCLGRKRVFRPAN